MCRVIILTYKNNNYTAFSHRTNTNQPMKNIQAYFAVVGSMFFWSFSFIWSKDALVIYSPFTILFFRLSLAAIVLLSIAKILGKLNHIDKNDWKYFLLLSFFEPFLYFIGETYGLQRVSSTIAAVLIATIPLFLPYVAYYIFKERLTNYKIYGTILSFVGVVLVIINGNMSLNADVWGILLLMLAVFSAVAYTAVLNKLSHKYNYYTIVGWQSALALIGFGPLFFIYDRQEAISIGLVWEGVRPVLLLGLFASIFAFVLFTYSIKKLGVTKSGIFSNAIPVFVSFYSFIFLNERLLFINYIGILIVVLGLFLSQMKKKDIIQA